MRRHFTTLLTAILITGAFHATAQVRSFEAVNHLQVIPISQTDFEVIESNGLGARGMWCAAADYLVNGPLNDTDGRLYVKTPRGPSVTVSGRTGAVFTLDASTLPDGPKRSYSVSVRTPGLGLPILHAFQFCKDYTIEVEDIFFRRGDG
ncbi:hypothetical protein Z945_1375 [Sulfitobacter noctilucae]|uniref:hypothetical protein n=1 Tax=Sulfitobacter noctilucae TaxID=1342302 RepID=UPI00046AC0CF|nr:hypothetical protein [Sulfitobacter noctilucae]KIN60404.1 hypothetical protein Z945_1375 [Sulfitobacter noctilucae]